jgi:uncharacterized protein (TIGR03067 family)
MRPLLALALLAGLAAAAPVPKELKKKDDKHSLLGTWKVTELTSDGKPTTASYHTFVFTDDGKLTLIEGKNKTGPQWTWAIDQSTTPRTMKWATGNPWDCVYELDGDSLKLGLLNKGAKPPASVEPGNGLTLYVMTRDTTGK